MKFLADRLLIHLGALLIGGSLCLGSVRALAQAEPPTTPEPTSVEPAPSPAPPAPAVTPAPSPATAATVPVPPPPTPAPTSVREAAATPRAASPAPQPLPEASRPAEATPRPSPPAVVRSSEVEYQNVRVQLSGTQEIQSVADPFRLQVKVSNRTGDDIRVTKLRWELPRSIVATRPEEKAAAGTITWSQGIDVRDAGTLPHQSEQLFDLEMPAISENWWTLPSNTRMLAFKPGEYPIKVRAEYTIGSSQRISVAEETIQVHFDTTPWFYIWGGILGSMVGVLFEFFYTAARGIDRYEWPKTERGRLAPGLVLRDAVVFLFRWLLGGTAKWLTGSLTAAIVLLFLYYYKNVHLPITIQINDFFGAVVVGLIAHRLGLWVYDTLFTRTDKTRGGGDGGTGRTEPFGFPQQVVPALTYTDRSR